MNKHYSVQNTMSQIHFQITTFKIHKEQNTNTKLKENKKFLMGGPRSYTHGKIFKGFANSSHDINCKSLKEGSMENITRLHNRIKNSFSKDDSSIIFTIAKQGKMFPAA